MRLLVSGRCLNTGAGCWTEGASGGGGGGGGMGGWAEAKIGGGGGGGEGGEGGGGMGCGAEGGTSEPTGMSCSACEALCCSVRINEFG